jgi:hypothetical protein
VADYIVPQRFPADLRWPVVQCGFSGRGGEVGRDGDQATAQGGAAGDGVVAAGDGSGGGSSTR